MVKIIRGQANSLVVTLKEKQTLTSPYFLVRFTNLVTNTTKVCIASDSSSYTDRYNLLAVTESTTELPLSGQIKLNYEGEWKYEVWEQSSSTNLNPDSATTLLETGICIVKSSTPANSYIERVEADTFIEYGSGT